MSPIPRALGVRNFRLYASGAAVSNVGTWMQRVAQDWLVLELTGSGTALGIVTALQFLPALVLSPYAGLIVDRFAKRRLLVLTHLSMSVLSVSLGLLTTTGVVVIWHVYLLALLFGVVTAFDAPARQTFVVELVSVDELSSAIGLNGAIFTVARVIGPALAGALIHWFGSGPVIIANGLSYGAVIVSLLVLRPSEMQASPRAERGRGMIRAGVRYLWRRPALMTVVTTVFVVGVFVLNVQLTSALMATTEFHKGAQEFGLLASMFALGSLTGAVLAARRARPRIRIVIGAGLGCGMIEIAAGLMPTYLTYVLMLPLMGLAAMTMLITANTLLQLSVAPTMRGRVTALYLTILMGSTTLGSPVLGWISQVLGPRWALIGGGALSVVGIVASTGFFARRQGLTIRPRLVPRRR